MSNDTDSHTDEWRAGYEEGVRATLVRATTTFSQVSTEDAGIKIDTVKLLRFALSDLPQHVEVLDCWGLPLRGEISDNYSYGKSLFVYGRKHRPVTLGEPF